jgi:hypothetical protein
MKAAQFQSLANENDIEEILSLFESLNAPSEEISFDSLDFIGTDSANGIAEDDEDLGVKLEKTKSYKELTAALGLDGDGRLQVLFNEARHVGGYTPWSPDHKKLFEDFLKGDPHADLRTIRLHWHQVAGVHATIRKIFTMEPSSSNPAGILIADEVGLGKTFLSITVSGWIIQLAMAQSLESPPPPPPIVGM